MRLEGWPGLQLPFSKSKIFDILHFGYLLEYAYCIPVIAISIIKTAILIYLSGPKTIYLGYCRI